MGFAISGRKWHADMAADIPLMSEATEVGRQASEAWPLAAADPLAIPALLACFPHGTGMAEEGRAPPPPWLVPPAQATSPAAPMAPSVGPAGEGLHRWEVTRERKICTSKNIPTSAI